MKTKTFRGSHSDVCHVWAHRHNEGFESGIGSNVFFEGNKIYSYGHHFEMARELDNGIILVNCRGYSVSTSKHQSYLHRAISHKKQFHVSHYFDLKDSAQSKNFAHKNNLERWEYVIKGIAEKVPRARQNKEWYLKDIVRNITAMQEYIDTFKVPKVVTRKFAYLFNSLQSYEDLANDIGQKRIAELKIKRAKERKVAKKMLREWKTGQRSTYHYYADKYSHLRYNPDMDCIETSQQIRLELDESRKLFRFIRALGDRIWESNGEQYKIGYYYINTITPDYVRAGCHLVKRTEINEIASQLGWM